MGGACSAGICQPVVLAAGLTRPSSMTVDGANVYWTEHSVGRVSSVAKAGGAPMVLADGLMNPGEIAAYAGTVYWTDAVAGTVSSLAVDGGSPVVVAAGLPQPDSIVVDATDVYFWNIGDGTVRRLAEPSVVVATGEAISGMALDAANLYYGARDGSVIKVPRGGGSAEILFAGPLTTSGEPQYPAWGLALDSEKVYWTALALFSNLPPGLVSSVP